MLKKGATVVIEFSEQRRRQNFSGFDQKHDLHQVLPVRFDQFPIYFFPKQKINMFVFLLFVGAIKYQIFYIPNARLQFDAGQIREI